jgi:hypothetical protein
MENAVIRRAASLHLEDHVGAVVGRGRGRGDRGAGGDVGLVGEAGAFAGPGLHADLEARLDQAGHRLRDEGDAGLVGRDFARNG